ncbi:hypothetical protein ACQJ8I_05255 [Helicobacter pylori]|nr:hypothetical protein [Helicobacter pylori]
MRKTLSLSRKKHIAVRLKEVKIPLVFYRVGNVHADYKEPFVLAFNV